MSVATETIDPTIVDGLTSLPDKPAAAAQPGASGQWQTLQPAGQPPAPPDAQTKCVSAPNDLWIGVFLQNRLPRSSSLTGSGGLCPVDSPAELTHATLKSSISKGKLSSIGQAHSWPPHAESNGSRTPVSLPRAWRHGAGTQPRPLRQCWSNSWASRLVQEPSPASPSGQARVGCPCFIATGHNGSRWSGAHSK